MVALPALGGSILRLVLGYLTDRIGPRKTAIIGMIATVVPLIFGWKAANSLQVECHNLKLIRFRWSGSHGCRPGST
ncbi:MFS transporter [Paenibacillus sp. SYP-B3998]|uniref:MFS transporter n=1 Tax=Paenibacillus sp. SYP-B3998 TaxID=2678564 RepID=UPI0031F9C0AF